MKRIVLLALNDLRLTARDRPALVWIVLMPIAMMWFFGNMGGGSTGQPKISLSVVDHDGGWLAAAFVEDLAGEQLALRPLEPAQAGQVEDKVRTLVIPAGFTAGVLEGEQQTLRLEKEPGSDDQFGFAAQTHIVRAIVRTLSRLVEMRQEGTLEAEGPDERFRVMGRREPPVRLEVSTAGSGRPVPSGRAQSVPGILTFIVLMMTLIYGGVFLTIEKRSGMLERQATAPLSRSRLFLGKLAGRLLIALAQIAILLVAGRFILGVSWGASPAGLALLLFSYASAVAGLSTLLGAVLRTPEQASSVGWILSMVLAALGGCWWPSELVPGWLWTAAHALPTAWAMDGFHALISFGQGVEAIWLPAVVLFGFATAFIALGARFLQFGR